MQTRAWLKLFCGSFLLYYGLQYSSSNETWWFMQNVNLIFHEAGHIFLWPFGNTLMLLGGSIFETLIPLIVTLYFMGRAAFFSASVTAWWLHSALMSVSIYISDAQERLLPLITGDSNTHDWYQLLTQWNVLAYDDVLGYFVWLLALGALGALALNLWLDRDIQALLHRYGLR